jgi:hypothetical protein
VRRSAGWTPGWLLAATLALAGPGAAQGTADTATTLPATVRSAIRDKWPRAAVRGFRIAHRDGALVYEIASEDRGRRRDLVYGADGRLLEYAEAIGADSLPGPVRAALRRDAEGGDIILARRVVRGASRSYEIELRMFGRTQLFAYDAGGHRQ